MQEHTALVWFLNQQRYVSFEPGQAFLDFPYHYDTTKNCYH